MCIRDRNSKGRPDDYSMRDNFIEYANDIWSHKLKPNVVLIDGRLRVFCFLVSSCPSLSELTFGCLFKVLKIC